jgi:hypothetical protein
MTTRGQRDFLKVQLLETQRLKYMVGDHPLMSVALAQRERELCEQLAAIPPGGKESRAVLFFCGEPVHGSMGIDASFASRVLEPFQNMVRADYADRWHGGVSNRGRRHGEAQSRLMLTGLPRGSFGLELSRVENGDLFVDGELADTLAHVTRLVAAAACSDEDFAAELDETAPRVVHNLRIFLDVIAKGRAGLRLESGDFRCEMSPVQASDAYSRVAATTTAEQTVTFYGVLKGVLLESWRFNFATDHDDIIAGKIDESMTEEQVIALNQEFFNRPCRATLIQTTVGFRNGRVRSSYRLTGVEAIAAPSNTTEADGS